MLTEVEALHELHHLLMPLHLLLYSLLQFLQNQNLHPGVLVVRLRVLAHLHRHQSARLGVVQALEHLPEVASIQLLHDFISVSQMLPNEVLVEFLFMIKLVFFEVETFLKSFPFLFALFISYIVDLIVPYYFYFLVRSEFTTVFIFC